MELVRVSRCFVLAVVLPFLGADAAAQSGSGSREKEPVAWVRGTVREEAGTPIAGAKVYARVTFHGGMRMEGLVRTAVADDQGHYVIYGPRRILSQSASLVAHAPGRPPALSWFTLGATRLQNGLFDSPESAPDGEEIDLVVPSRGGTLEVVVLKEGLPLPSASVALRLEGVDPLDIGAPERESDELQALYGICRPTSSTGADGIARFEGLLPGMYSVLAMDGPWQRISLGWAKEYQVWSRWSLTRPYGESHHIAVRVGEVSTHQVSIFPRRCAVTFDVVRDGKPWKELEPIDLGMAMASGDRVIYGVRRGGHQSTVYEFESGITPVCFANATRGRTSPRTFPFFSADGVIAASPRLANSLPVRLAADVSRGGMIRVRIEDTEGSPVAGKASFRAIEGGGLAIDSGVRDIAAEGTLIMGFQPAKGWVTGYIPDRPRLILSENLTQIPANDVLTGRVEVLPQFIMAENNRVQEVTLREQHVGYVRGRIKPPTGRKPSDYRVLIGRSDIEQGAGVCFDRVTGEFVAGPFRTGRPVLRVYTERSVHPILFRKVDVRAGEVAEMEIEIGDDSEQRSPQQRILTARVVLDDGTTPACLASLGRYSPAERQKWIVGTTDTSGIARPRWQEVIDDVEFDAAPGTAEEPVVLAWTPGRHGVSIVPFPAGLDEPLVIRLPPPLSLRGQVIVEGEDGPITNGTLTVRAQYQGRGNLDDWLSVETTAGADGAFELSGLTPGRYRIQATLDGIWLSSSMDFTAGVPNQEPAQLSIPAPGRAVLVRVSGPLSEEPAKLFVLRPPGPLTDRLWPKHLTADGDGVIRIPALEAGRHVIRIGNTERVVEVPSLKESNGHPVEVEFETQ